MIVKLIKLNVFFLPLPLRLSEKVAYSDYISPVCLPVKDEDEPEEDEPEDSAAHASVDNSSGGGGSGQAYDNVSTVAPSENEIPQGSEPAKAQARVLRDEPKASSGIVVGWGAVEKFGDSAGNRKFLKEWNQSLRAVNRSTTSPLELPEDILRLRKVELPLIDKNTCQAWYASQGRPIHLIDQQFCAGLFEGGKDACRVRTLIRWITIDVCAWIIKLIYWFHISGRLGRTDAGTQDHLRRARSRRAVSVSRSGRGVRWNWVRLEGEIYLLRSVD